MIKLPFASEQISIVAKIQHFYDYLHHLKNTRNMDFVSGQENCTLQEMKNLEELEEVYKTSFNHILYKEEKI